QGWLDRGDPRYLQNKLGQSQQRGPDRFYREFFQSLCLQGIALPIEERTAAIAVMIGDVPYLGGCLFQPHPLEQRYPQISIGDRSFEAILTWFSDYCWQWHEPTDLAQPDSAREPIQHPPTVTLPLLRQSFQYFANSLTSGRPYALAPEMVQATCDRVILGQLVSQLADGQNSDYHPDYQDDSQPNDGQNRRPDQDALTLAKSWPVGLTPALARQLRGDILPNFQILDPACGSGALLLGAMDTLAGVYKDVEAAIATSKSQSQPAESPILEEPQSALTPPVALCHRILTRNLYGIELNASALELAKLQLLLQVLSKAERTELIPLPVIEFNLLPGNALIGITQVDAEGFDRVGRQSPPAPDAQVLQGNLLQPLMAEDYRTIVAEKQVSLENYQTQTQLMAEVAAMPEYAQTEFLRDHIQTLNQTAQSKLDRLLLQEFSQKLGIRYRQPRPKGRTRRRVLTLSDIQDLQPFHWGFHFHQSLNRRGGFDVVLSDLPWGVLRPTAQQFLRQYRHLAQRKNLDSKRFRRSRSNLLQTDSELAQHWSRYSGQFTPLSQYFRRSGHYPYQQFRTPLASQSMPLYLERLFIERCWCLLRQGGAGALFLPSDRAQSLVEPSLSQLPLSQLIKSRTSQPSWEISHSHQQWPSGKRHSLSLLRFTRTPSTESPKPPD
ncbi:MAG: DNA methyltransferase, partial [Cyanobacteria bacterium P01_H01_bin.119]